MRGLGAVTKIHALLHASYRGTNEATISLKLPPLWVNAYGVLSGGVIDGGVRPSLPMSHPPPLGTPRSMISILMKLRRLREKSNRGRPGESYRRGGSFVASS